MVERDLHDISTVSVFGKSPRCDEGEAKVPFSRRVPVGRGVGADDFTHVCMYYAPLGDDEHLYVNHKG